MSWTDERVETLKRMWAEGQSASQIAKELGGVTRNAVIGKVHRLGLSKPRRRQGRRRDCPAPAVKLETAARASSPPRRSSLPRHGLRRTGPRRRRT